MKTTLSLAAVAVLTTSLLPQGRGLDWLLPPPEFVATHAVELGVPADRATAILDRRLERKGEYDALRSRSEQLRLELRTALTGGDVDVEEASECFRALLDAEHEMKLILFEVRVNALSLLTPEQRDEARTLLKRRIANRRELEARIERVRELGRRCVRSGRSPHGLIQRMQEVRRHIGDGRIDEALELLDDLTRDLESSLCG